VEKRKEWNNERKIFEAIKADKEIIGLIEMI